MEFIKSDRRGNFDNIQKLYIHEIYRYIYIYPLSVIPKDG